MEVVCIFGVLVCLLSLFFSLQRALELGQENPLLWQSRSRTPRLSAFIQQWDASAGWLAATLAWALLVWSV